MIKDCIYKHFESKSKRVYDKNNITFSPSTILDCDRKIYYKYNNIIESNPIEPHTNIKFEMGNAVHEKVGELISNLDDINIIETEIDKSIEKWGLRFNYRLDYVVEMKDKKYVLEIKSTYNKGNVDQEAKEEHILQMMLYMIFENINDGILLYINRDNAFMTEFHFNIDDLNNKYSSLLEKIIIKKEFLIKQITLNDIPNRDFKIYLKKDKKSGIITDEFQKDNKKYKSDWQCSYCNYRNDCWQEVFQELLNSDHQFYIDNKFI